MRRKSVLLLVGSLIAALVPAAAQARTCSSEEFFKQRYFYSTEDFHARLAFDTSCLPAGTKLVYEYLLERNDVVMGQEDGGSGACTRENAKCVVKPGIAHPPVERAEYAFSLKVSLHWDGGWSEGSGSASWTCTSLAAAAFCD